MTLGSAAADVVGPRSDSRSVARLKSTAARSTSGRRRIRCEIDANAPCAVYRGHMKLESLLERRAVDALVVAVTVFALSDADSAAGVAAAVAPLPLLFRRRLPFAAPALVFAVLAGMSLVDRGAASGHEILTVWSVCALALAFWFAGAHGEREQAIACAAVGLASLTVVTGSAGAEFNIIDEASSATGIGGWVLLGGGLALAGYALRRRAQRAEELEQRALRLERER